MISEYSAAKLLIIFELRKRFGIFVAFHSVFLWHFIRHFCGISFGVFAVFPPGFHKFKPDNNYCMNNKIHVTIPSGNKNG